MHMRWISTLSALVGCVVCFPYDEAEVAFNLNVNPHASNPLEYEALWANHTYHPSPQNWRFPFYSFMPDRFVNGDPTNDDINGTAWEFDPSGTQLRAGGDIQGVIDSLDYIEGMGIRGIYFVGSPMINMPWGADQYSPLDHTLLDHHLGDLATWRSAIEAIHARGMYVLLDNTMATLGDLIGFDGYLNSSAPWSFEGHDTSWKSERRYVDWNIDNEYLEVCDVPYPRFWDQSGHQIHDNNTSSMIGCRKSEFDQYGDVGAFEQATEWRKELSKFAGVQDRLAEWKPSVLAKIEHFSCMMIAALDIDGFRMDKGMQITVDAQGNFSAAMRTCAKQFGKNNFFIPGEMVNGNTDSSIYIGRGKEPEMGFTSAEQAFRTNRSSNGTSSSYIRESGHNALDAAVFHYTTYRNLLRFLGLDGEIEAAFDTPVNFVESWNTMVMTNDMVNAETGSFDPRHMHGVENHDVFRWSGLEMGPARHGLGAFITTLLMPGMPLLSWGEEQAFHTLDSTAPNYLFGRQFMASSQAWQRHGCYKLGDANLNNAPFDSSLFSCENDSVSLDHRDPSHPKYVIFKMMFEMRRRYPILQDGWVLQQLSNQTFNYTLPGSFGMPTEVGLYSVLRSRFSEMQDFTGVGQGNQDIWLLYSNLNASKTFAASCQDDAAILSSFPQGSTVKNLFHPFEELVLQNSSSSNLSCLPSIEMRGFDYKAFVPIGEWLSPSPHVTRFTPGHDARLLSKVSPAEQEEVPIAISFSHNMSCDSVKNSIEIKSATEDGSISALDMGSINCSTVDNVKTPERNGAMPSLWTFHATLLNVSNGIHVISVRNASTATGTGSTSSIDKFTIRIGQADNPMVFPATANYSSSLLHQNPSDQGGNPQSLYIEHKAAGADKFRYSTNWGSSWSAWQSYSGGNSSIKEQAWSGTNRQKWDGTHVQVQYWSKTTGSSSHLQEGDLAYSGMPVRRFPHVFVHGAFNQFGFDAGIANEMRNGNGSWTWDYMTEWPASFQLNVWGINADGQPDLTQAYGDVDNDTVLDRIPPVSLERAVVNITDDVGGMMGPPAPHLAWRIVFNDGSMRYTLVPVGSRWAQLTLFILLALVPAATAIIAVFVYRAAFYRVRFNTVGLSEKKSLIPFVGALKEKLPLWNERGLAHTEFNGSTSSTLAVSSPSMGASLKRRTVLIGTIEYNIEDWGIKIKIGGLGVMAQLMGQNLSHQDLVWVVPCIGDVEYPTDTPAEPMKIQILGKDYEVNVQYHKLNNITYVLLDAPIFRQQSKADPYPARMDDIESAIFYSAWNQCLAETMRRFPIDLYHINDYHGTVAPLYLLPSRTVPCCLSLHNAEFQGLWPMRTPQERDEICDVFNLPLKVVQKYVQFGEVFNLLHAGASILRVHQDGFGAVGVSTKYGQRSFARYPIFWNLKKVGALSNPDPSDLDDWDRRLNDPKLTVVDKEFEAGRGELRRKAQEWAGLEQNPNADLFVFVGRWSLQKGVDLIADVFPAILEKHPNAQLLCVGPVIDLYGKFAALKLSKMMEKYPGRVYSKPEFTALPPYIFSGAEFALIPSRDEPFGLVGVEFGRKGALSVGARVGGLGQVCGWWYTVESLTTKHLVRQFKSAIEQALKSDTDTRAIMRARSAKTRFPVQQWKEDLEILQSTSIRMHEKYGRGNRTLTGKRTPRMGGSGSQIGIASGWSTPTMMRSPQTSAPQTRDSSPIRQSLGLRTGPGHTLNLSSLRLGRWSLPGSRVTSRENSPDRSPEAGISSISHSSSFGNLPYVAHRSAASSRNNSRDPSPEGARRPSRVSFDIADGPRKSPLRPMTTILDDHEAAAVSPKPSSDSNEVIISEELARVYTKESQRQSRYLDGSIRYPEEAHIARRDYQVTKDQGTSSGTATPLPLQLQTPFRYSPDSAQPSGIATPLSPSTDNGSHTDLIDHEKLHLSLERVLGSKDNKSQQDLTPFFTDPTGQYYRQFESRLEKLDGKTSEGSLCIEEYLVTSEKSWFQRLHRARMTPLSTKPNSPAGSIMNERLDSTAKEKDIGQFNLPDDYKPPSGVRRLLNTKLGDWPIYAFLLALGQILAANSYQITLLTGQVGQPAAKLYSIAGIYLASSIAWWAIFRKFRTLYVLSLPWAFYGLAFFFLAVSPYGSSVFARGWLQNVAFGLYAVGSSAGSFFFSQNFASTGAAPVKAWGFRACTIQGTQQIYLVALWYWGSVVSLRQDQGLTSSIANWKMTAIAMPIAVLLWLIGIILFLGLPDFYRQTPGVVPSFYTSILRRKIILWFFVAVALQTYFLSATYGRNWSYLWSSKHAPAWAIVILIIVFFVIVWASILLFFSHESITHSWILPIFAIGLGAPRWCQMLWSTSNIGTYLPWAGGPVVSALLGRGLWLWLGVLDSLQGVGFGMILLQTLTRFHISFSLVAAQVIGSIFTILARATASNKIGPGDVFPDFSAGFDGLGKAWFWVALLAQGVICCGFFAFFRREQLSKP